MKRLAVIVRRDRIAVDDLSSSIRGDGRMPAAAHSAPTLKEAVEALERRMIAEALEKCGHNRQQTARAIGLSRQGLIKKLKRFGMDDRARSR